jgi:hypothetical protein
MDKTYVRVRFGRRRSFLTAEFTFVLTIVRTIDSSSRFSGYRPMYGNTPMTTPHDVHATVVMRSVPPARSSRARNGTALRQ